MLNCWYCKNAVQDLKACSTCEAGLVDKYDNLVGYIRCRYFNPPPSWYRGEPADLHQAGIIGLLKAIRRYDPDRGMQFKFYAFRLVRAYMTREVRRGMLVNIPQRLTAAQRAEAVRSLVYLGQTGPNSDKEMVDLPCRHGPSPPARQDGLDVEEVLKKLPETHRKVVQSFLEGNHQGILAKEWGMTRQWISHLYRQAIRMCRDFLKGQGWDHAMGGRRS